jgi:hypothetical protein
MPGTLIYKKFISRADIQATFPTHIYLFGDNMKRVGMGGQAASMRGEPNSFGVPTKWAPDSQTSSYFKDEDWGLVEDAILFPFLIALAWIRAGKTVVTPLDGLGTGLAELPTRAPKIFETIKIRLEILEVHAFTRTDRT